MHIRSLRLIPEIRSRRHHFHDSCTHAVQNVNHVLSPRVPNKYSHHSVKHKEKAHCSDQNEEWSVWILAQCDVWIVYSDKHGWHMCMGDNVIQATLFETRATARENKVDQALIVEPHKMLQSLWIDVLLHDLHVHPLVQLMVDNLVVAHVSRCLPQSHHFAPAEQQERWEVSDVISCPQIEMSATVDSSRVHMNLLPC